MLTYIFQHRCRRFLTAAVFLLNAIRAQTIKCKIGLSGYISFIGLHLYLQIRTRLKTVLSLRYCLKSLHIFEYLI